MLSPDFFNLIQKKCLPGIWSKGVSLAREGRVSCDSRGEEYVLRVSLPDRPISQKVSLWPKDEDWLCNCGDRSAVCAHVAASIIALKNEAAQSNSQARTDAPSPSRHLGYFFSRVEGRLAFERKVLPEGARLAASLVSMAGGLHSGRISGPPLSATQDDYLVDGLLKGDTRAFVPDRMTLVQVLKALTGHSHVFLDQVRIEVSGKPLSLQVSLVDESKGYRIKLGSGTDEQGMTGEMFQNGASLCNGLLRPIEAPIFDAEEKQLIGGAGTLFVGDDAVKRLVLDWIPRLERKISVQIRATGLPTRKKIAAHIDFKLEPLGDDLVAVASLVNQSGAGAGELLWVDPQEEKILVQKLRAELQLVPGQSVKIDRHEIGPFLEKIKRWKELHELDSSFKNEIRGLNITLEPRIEVTESGLQIHFEAQGIQAEGMQVIRSWRENQSYVSLIGGGWAKLPSDWLNRYGERILELLNSKHQGGHAPQLVPQLTELCDEIGQNYPDTLKKLRDTLEYKDPVPLVLPRDLKASLRHYQEDGVKWLTLLKNAGVGALLADDMGLGKTLQTLCVIEGRTLIVAPTSVLHSWMEQTKIFRPSLRVQAYWGSNRKLGQSQITLTSYAILRLDRELLTKQDWNTIVLDEAQTIRNPDSQVARAAFGLSGKFKIALSGTPIENRPEDLWSQFHFINPGLLGTREHFKDRFSDPMKAGSADAAQALKKRVRPFLLRRLKTEVAPELPPKTEIVLTCELSKEERELYDSILATSKNEVIAALTEGASIFGALEMLLRLRQACCHAALVPGSGAGPRSSKVDLLLETLEESIGLGHRALVFSQWTGYLDLIENELRRVGISYCRLDGTTKDRSSVVDQFQDPKGPSVMLISLKAGGVGLTLTAADHIFLMDPWWNPTVEDQAAGRAHRIGQTQPVLVHRLVAENTLEDKILELQKLKAAVAEQIIGDGSASGSLSRDDLISLLS